MSELYKTFEFHNSCGENFGLEYVLNRNEHYQKWFQTNKERIEFIKEHQTSGKPL